MRRVLIALACAAPWASTVRAQVLQVAELNTAQIRALDLARTAVILPGGILEEHGPYLPSYIRCCGSSAKLMAPEAAREDGFTVHAGLGETAGLMFLRPDLVPEAVRSAPSLAREAAIEARHQEWLRTRTSAVVPAAR